MTQKTPKAKKAKQPMHPALILAELKMAGHSYVSVAKHFGISSRAIENVVKSKAKSRRIAQRIADLIGQPVDDIWPGEYNYVAQPSFKERCNKQVAA